MESFQLLAHHERELWSRYRELEALNCRREAIKLLAEFVAAISGYPKDQLQEWVHRFSNEVLHSEEKIAVRQPLFGRILLPVLLEDYLDARPQSARMLLHFYPLIHGGHLNKDVIKGHDLSQFALLEAVIHQEPNDREFKRELIKLYDNWFDYTLHEIPAGVLYGPDGTTLAGCDELLQDLQRFIELVEQEQVTEAHQDLIADCRLHFNAYKDYLLHREEYQGYEDYLRQNGIEFEQES